MEPSLSRARARRATASAGGRPRPRPAVRPPYRAAFMPYFAGAAQRFALGSDGWAYLAAINSVESSFDDTSFPGVATGANASGTPLRSVGGALGNRLTRGTSVAGGPVGATPPRERRAVVAARGQPAAQLRRAVGGRCAICARPAGWSRDRVSGLAARSAGGTAASPPRRARPPPGQRSAAPTAAAVLTRAGGAPRSRSGRGARRCIAAGNQIAVKPYVYGAGHGCRSYGRAAAYDCSSSVAHLLYGAATSCRRRDLRPACSSPSALRARRRWVTIYAGPEHVFMYVAGLRWDTHNAAGPDDGGSGIGWHPLDPRRGRASSSGIRVRSVASRAGARLGSPHARRAAWLASAACSSPRPGRGAPTRATRAVAQVDCTSPEKPRLRPRVTRASAWSGPHSVRPGCDAACGRQTLPAGLRPMAGRIAR